MDVESYIMGFLIQDNPQLNIIEKQYRVRDDAVPSIGPEVGKLLGLIARAIEAKRVMEFGTSLGYSSVWLGEAMRATGGKLISVEMSKKLYEATRDNVEKAGLSDYVDLIYGDAKKIIYEVEGPFDMILQDSAKPLYPVMLDKCVDLLRMNGILAADDGLFLPLGYEEENATPMDEYNKLVFADHRLYSTILPIGDGLTLSVKVRE
jgi:predicted O-methyltransferase YrrM